MWVAMSTHILLTIKLTTMIERHNELEQRMFDRVQLIVPMKRIYPVTYSSDHIKRILKRNENFSTIFLDAPSPYLTINDNYKKTEGVISVPKNGIFWRIECKSQENYSDLIGRVLLELNFVAKLIEDKYCLILEKAFMLSYALKIIDATIREKNLINKVWRGSLDDFEVMLLNKMSKAM